MRPLGLGMPDGWALVAGGVVLVGYGAVLALLLWAAWSGLTAWIGH